VIFTSYGWIKTRPVKKLLIWVKFTGSPYSYRTCINENGHHWNTCKLVFLGARISHMSMWMHHYSALGNVHTNLGFSMHFCSWVSNPLRERQTDGKMNVFLTLVYKHHVNDKATACHTTVTSLTDKMQQGAQKCLVSKRYFTVVLIAIATTIYMVLLSWHRHRQSSPSSFDEYNTSAGRSPTFAPSQSA